MARPSFEVRCEECPIESLGEEGLLEDRKEVILRLARPFFVKAMIKVH